MVKSYKRSTMVNSYKGSLNWDILNRLELVIRTHRCFSSAFSGKQNDVYHTQWHDRRMVLLNDWHNSGCSMGPMLRVEIHTSI
jgi:hypothetical protein